MRNLVWWLLDKAVSNMIAKRGFRHVSACKANNPRIRCGCLFNYWSWFVCLVNLEKEPPQLSVAILNVLQLWSQYLQIIFEVAVEMLCHETLLLWMVFSQKLVKCNESVWFAWYWVLQYLPLLSIALLGISHYSHQKVKLYQCLYIMYIALGHLTLITVVKISTVLCV